MGLARSTYTPPEGSGNTRQPIAPGATRIEDLPPSVLDFCARVLEGKRTDLAATFPPEILGTETGRILYAKAWARRELLTQLSKTLRLVAAGESTEKILNDRTQHADPSAIGDINTAG